MMQPNALISTVWKRISQLSFLFTLTSLLSCAGMSQASACFEEDEGGEVLDRVDVRFAEERDEVPDFQRHVSPLLGRLGCNGRACHGSFQGQGGFRLSLFGYDFDADCDAILSEGSGRVDLQDPEESLILLKGTATVDHEGGERFAEDGWEYRILNAWITAGAPRVDAIRRLEQLEVTPSEIIFDSERGHASLQVVARWADGTREDVTPLARFQSNDPQIAEVDHEGQVRAGAFGDSNVVVSYDNAVVAVPVLRPFDSKGQVAAEAYSGLDALVQDKLDKMHLSRSDLADDATFLRRVSLDIAGTLPSPDEVRRFLEDTSPNKRAAKIDELLESPAYTAWWTTFLCDMTGNNSQELRNVSFGSDMPSEVWYDWIRARVEQNTPYDEIIAGIVLAASRQNDQTYMDYCRFVSAAGSSKSTEDLVACPTMPFYWMRRETQDRETRAIAFAQNFLGVQIQCAQCHKHPFDRWSQQDFEEFSRFFSGVEVVPPNRLQGDDKADYEAILSALGVNPRMRGGELQKAIREAISDNQVVPFPSLEVTRAKLTRQERQAYVDKMIGADPDLPENELKKLRNEARSRGPLYHQQARLLGSEQMALKEIGDIREPVMEWMRSRDNPYFARAFVNRVWARYFGVGIVNPIDDLNLANPPSNRPLLDYLAEGFVDHGFDMKWLHREIANSRTYQTTWQPQGNNAGDQRNFSHALPRRLPAELIVDAITQVCSPDDRNASYVHAVAERATTVPGTDTNRFQVGGRNAGFALQAFGRSERENNCDCDRSNETSLIQTVYLQNDQDIHAWIAHPKGWVAQFGTSRESEAAIQDLRSEQNQLQSRYRKLERNLRKIDKRKSPDQFDRVQAQLVELREQHEDLNAAIEAIQQGPSDSDLEPGIEEAYLRCLGRFPSEDEVSACQRFIDESKSVKDGMAGVLWTLINTKEFIVNH